MTECTQTVFNFHTLDRRAVEARFDGGCITSDAGTVLLREVERRVGVIARAAACFTDYRDPDSIEHPLEKLIAQRVFGIAMGYEDLNDHEHLRADPLFAVLANCSDVQGTARRRARDKGCALAGKSTLNRLELSPDDANADSRYKKIVYNTDAFERLLVDLFLEAYPTPPNEITLDLDTTDDPLHGHQEGRFFHGYYREYCYLPLYIFCGEHLLCAKLRTADQDGAAGCLDEVRRIVEQIRARWPNVAITLRGDSGFCRDELLAWCESNTVFYCVGLAKNERLKKEIAVELEQAKKQHDETKKAARVFKDFRYRTLNSWSAERRVIGKAEHLDKGSNPRFVVTNLPVEKMNGRDVYEDFYCARGEMENRIKEQQMYLFADRTSAATMRANQLRLWFSSLAYILLQTLRRIGLKGTEMERAQCGTIRLKVLKIGARIQVSVRRVLLSLAEAYPYKVIFAHAHRAILAMPLRC